MGAYRCWAYRTYKISKEMYDFTLIVYGNCHAHNGFYVNKDYDRPFTVERDGNYMFCGTERDWEDMCARCLYLEDNEKTDEAIKTTQKIYLHQVF